MDAREIKNIGKKLAAFLKQFDDCFYRGQPRGHLKSYVRGQVSGLQRKSAEPIALLAKTPPRTLQRFLSYVHWDEQILRDRIQVERGQRSYPHRNRGRYLPRDKIRLMLC